jgi:tetratricopeptide (TPR) repeat protein
MMASGMLSARRSVRALISGAILLLVTSLATTSRADDDARADAGARYARGIELANQGLYEAALEQFKAAYAESPHFAVLYNIGQAQIALGRSIDAIESLSRYLRDGADQVPLSRREQVQAQIGLLESRLAELTIATEPAGAAIRVDGRDLGRTPLFQPVRLAAGTHSVTAVFPGGAEVTRAITLGESERQKLELAFATAPAAVTPPAVAAPLAATPPAPALLAEHPQERAPRGPAMRRTAYALAAAGVLAGGGALAVYLGSRSRFDDWKAGNARLASDIPGSAAYSMQASANNALAASLTTANRAIWGLSIGASALVAAGVTLFAVDRSRDRAGGGELSFGLGSGSSASVAWRTVW